MTKPAWLLCGSCHQETMVADQFCLSCHPERRLAGRYHVEAVRAAGGRGVVYRAHDERLNAPVAIKVTPAGRDDNRERQILVDHARDFDFVPQVYAALNGPQADALGSPSDFVYLVMTYFDAPSLAQTQMYAGRADRVEHFLRVMLGYLHQLHSHTSGGQPVPIYHLDLKPANILEQGERYVLLDFGSAAYGANATRSGPRTPSYAAPEQLDVAPDGPPDGRADLFSLALTACVLYTALESADFTRRMADLRTALEHAAGPSLPAGVGPLPPHLEQALARMLAWDRRERPSSAWDALACLEAPHGRSVLSARAVFAPHRVPAADVTLGQGRATHVAWSPDGGRLAVATPHGTCLYDAQSFDPVGQYAPSAPGRLLQFHYTRRGDVVSQLVRQSPPQALAAGHLVLNELALGPQAVVDTEEDLPDDTLAVSPAGQWLALGRSDCVHLLEYASRAPRAVLPAPDGRLTQVAVSQDGSRLALASDKTVEVWQLGPDLAERALRARLSATDATSLALSREGALLAIGQGGWIDLWQLGPREHLGALPVAAQPVTHMAFAPDGQRLAVVARGLALIWKISGESVTLLPQHAPAARSLVVSPDRRYVAALGGSMLCVWRVADGRLHWSADGNGLRETALAFNPDGDVLAASMGAGVRLWNVGERRVLATSPTEGRVRALAFSEDGQRLTVVGTDTVSRWSWQAEAAPDTRHDALGEAVDAALSQDGETLAVLTPGKVGIHSLGGRMDWASAADEAAHSLALSPDGRQVAVVSDASVAWWRCGDATPAQCAGGADHARFASDGSALALVRGPQVSIWRAAEGASPRCVFDGGVPVGDVALVGGAPALLVAAVEDGTVRVRPITV